MADSERKPLNYPLKIAVNLIGVGLCVAGAVHGVIWAGNLFRFLIWAQLGLIAIVLVTCEIPPAKPRPWTPPRVVVAITGWSTVLIAASAGWFFTATADLVACFFAHALDFGAAKPRAHTPDSVTKH